MLTDLLSLPSLPYLLNLDKPEAEEEDDVYLDTLNIDSKYMHTEDLSMRIKDKECFNFLNFNVRSLSANLEEVNNLLKSPKNPIDVALLTES